MGLTLSVSSFEARREALLHLQEGEVLLVAVFYWRMFHCEMRERSDELSEMSERVAEAGRSA